MNSLEVLTRYIRYLKIPLAKSEINAAFLKHSELIQTDPNSLLAMKETFDSLNIANETFSIEPSLLVKLPLPFVAYLTSNGGEFALVTEAEPGRFIVSNNQWDHLSVSIEDFQKVFSGIVLIAEADEDYQQEGRKSALREIKQERDVLKPAFLVIGAQKAGTTSFYDYLDYHPNFKKSVRKEVHFFNYNFQSGIDWYHENFPEKVKSNDFTGEATPCYLIHPLVPERVFNYSPEIKIICLLRDPVDRAYSHYRMLCGQNFESLTFEAAIDLEEERISSEFKKIITLGNYNSFDYQKFSYLTRGRYAEHIRHWLKFFNKEQFLFIDSKDLKKNPQNVFDEVCNFINVPAFRVDQQLESNTGSYVNMSDETRTKLKDYFRPYNEDLKDLTGIDFNG